MVCDACQAEIRELEAENYRPQFTPRGLPEAA
jgi:hypothetical protein